MIRLVVDTRFDRVDDKDRKEKKFNDEKGYFQPAGFVGEDDLVGACLAGRRAAGD